MSEGWIALHRGWRDNPVFRGEYSRADAWVWLIENAAWKPSRVRIKGEMVDLDRGELSFAQRFLAEKWGWSKSRVDRFIAELRDQGMIQTRSKNGATTDHAAGQGQCVISICNYAKYQDIGESQRGNDDASSGATAGQQRGKEEQRNQETSLGEEAKASPPPRAKRAPAVPVSRMTADWVPGPLPADVAALVAHWPPGRLDREAAATRDYWLTRNTKRPGWDLTFHNRIRDVHDRVLREASYGQQPNRNAAPGDRRDGIARALDRRLGLDEAPGATGRSDPGAGEGDSFRPVARLIAQR